MRRLLIIVLGALVVRSLALAAWEVDGFLWSVKPEGAISAGWEDTLGTTVDLADDLGYGGHEVVGGAGCVAGDRHQLGADVFQVAAQADGKIAEEIEFFGLRFPVTVPVHSSLDAFFARGFYRFNLGADKVRSGLTLGAQYNDLSAEISAPFVGSAQGDIRTVLPYGGIHLDYRPIEALRFRGRLFGSSWDYGDTRVAFLDIEISALYQTTFGLFAGAGFRYISIDGRDTSQPADIDLTLSGPQLLAGFVW